jgi:hypothetical protein
VPHAGESARFYQKQFALTKWRASITSAPVFKLHGYPGPYGYDAVIEKILATFKPPK